MAADAAPTNPAPTNHIIVSSPGSCVTAVIKTRAPLPPAAYEVITTFAEAVAQAETQLDDLGCGD